MADLTATIITHNEGETIRACLESLTWVKEIVVVDSGSSDRTVEICRGYTDKVVYHPWCGFIEQKNFALTLATYDWILSIDADERVPDELREAIERELCAPRHDGYWMARRNYFLGRWMRHGGWYPDRVLRLFDRRKGQFRGYKVHERVVISGGSTGVIDGYLVHATYRNISQYIRKQDLYTGISAEERLRSGRRLGPVSGTELLLRPVIKFVQVYVLKRGVLDGVQGLIAAVGAACFNFIKYAKLREAGERANAGCEIEDRQARRHAPTTPPVVADEMGWISAYVQRIDRDSTARALELQQAGARVRPFDLLLRPLSTFLRNYLRQGGVLDGCQGLTMAGLLAARTFATYAKLWDGCRIHRDV